MHIFLALQTAFSLWMLIDAIKRRAPEYWWLIILVPFGEWAYFFAVKLPDTRYGADLAKKLFSRPVRLADLRDAYAETPSHENRLHLAQALHDSGEFAEAAALFEQVLRRDEDDKDSLYGYARCMLETGSRAMAVRVLERLVDIDMGFRDFEACFDLAALYREDGDHARALELLEKVCTRSQRIGPRRALAESLVACDRVPEARDLLERALRIYDSSPSFVRRTDRAQARAARALLRRL